MILVRKRDGLVYQVFRKPSSRWYDLVEEVSRPFILIFEHICYRGQVKRLRVKK